MAPIRSMTLPKQPLKTERTHEENQERAYIAASRRSDRSLEARIESARRASDIHKRRTGRSLRVTEQDVVNEEMYEEEDDVLPLQYRRLTAHLNTASPDFNRQLAAYVTNHVAMRNALALTSNLSLSNSGNVSQWGPSNFEAAQPWLESQKLEQQRRNSQTPVSPNQRIEHHRSLTFPSADQSSIEIKKTLSGEHLNNNSSNNKRRTSCTLDTSAIDSCVGSPNISPTLLKTRSSSTSLLPTLKSQSSQEEEDQSQERPSKRAKQSNIEPSMLLPIPPAENFGPLTTQLSRDTELFFQPFYSGASAAAAAQQCGLNEFDFGEGIDATVKREERPLLPRVGIDQTLTLAPPMLDYGHDFDPFDQDQWTGNDLDGQQQQMSPFYSNMPPGFDNSYGNDTSLKHALMAPSPANGQTSGSTTPLERDWSAYLDSSVWDDTTSNR